MASYVLQIRYPQNIVEFFDMLLKRTHYGDPLGSTDLERLSCQKNINEMQQIRGCSWWAFPTNYPIDNNSNNNKIFFYCTETTSLSYANRLLDELKKLKESLSSDDDIDKYINIVLRDINIIKKIKGCIFAYGEFTGIPLNLKETDPYLHFYPDNGNQSFFIKVNNIIELADPVLVSTVPGYVVTKQKSFCKLINNAQVLNEIINRI